MLNEFRTKELIWDKATKQIYETFEANSGDSNGRKLEVQVLDGGLITDLSGTQLYLSWKTKDNEHKGLDAFKAVNLSEGIFEISYTTEMLSNVGKLRASLVLVDEVGRVESNLFTIRVLQSNVDDDSVQSEDSFTALTEALITVSQYDTRISGVENSKADKTEVDELRYSTTEQLAHTDDYLNQLQNIILNGELTPYFIENLATFSWVGSGVPENLEPYEGGNYYLEITGNAGDDFVTVKGGHDIIDAGADRKWAAVIKDNEGNWEPYNVRGTNGSDRVYVYPNLKKDIADGEIGNLHDLHNGQHMTLRGTQAFAQHAYNSIPKYANRLKYIEKFYYEEGGENPNPWTRVGQVYTDSPNAANLTEIGGGYFEANRKIGIIITTYAEGNTGGIEWEVDLDNHKGFLETFVRGSRQGETVIAEYYLDNELQETVYITDLKIRRLLFDFGKENKTGKIKFTIENSTKLQGFKVFDTTWWVTEKEHSNKIIPPHSKVVTYMDSWGTFHDYEFSRHLSKLISQDSGTTVDVIDHSQGGTTSIRGVAWFEEYVIKERPTHVVISYFTNDQNSLGNSLPYNYIAPDGQTYSGKLTSREEYREKIFDMINLAISHGIQPIVIQPSSTASFSQTTAYTELDSVLMQGEKI